ncbi:hypothetical protein MMC30_005631 [Trapelia coarctata]|nr:hypothetical protein [Trapelia coarctata]
MTLEDFEKELAESRKKDEVDDSRYRHGKSKEHGNEHHSHHRSHHRESEVGHRHKRRRRSREDEEEDRHRRHKHDRHRRHDKSAAGNGEVHPEKDANGSPAAEQPVAPGDTRAGLQRDSWMEAPSAIDIEVKHRRPTEAPQPTTSRSSKADFELKIHDNELNKHHLQELADGNDKLHEALEQPAQHEVDYEFGDEGAQWRMTKLKAAYRQAEESGRTVEEVALDKFGDLRAFDDAREEQLELERRETYGEGYVGKVKPSGELFQERKLEAGVRREHATANSDNEEEEPRIRIVDSPEAPRLTTTLDQTALNKLKAQMMKAKLRGASDAAKLEAEYNIAAAAFANRKEPEVVVLGTMENRMLAGGRKGEVKNVENKRGRERGLVEENEDMSIEDMVREERRTRGQAGGEGQRFAERIAKDGKFDNDLEYMDENANKLAKRVQKSEINLRNTAISDFQKMNRILDSCPLCHHEDTDTPPAAPVVSLATRVYLTLPTEPEISEGGACIVPIQHRTNLLECDDDEWEEIRNFMKSLIRMYHDQGRAVIFYENAAVPQRKKHAAMEVVPLPYSLGETAPAFFKEAILTADEEWTQHKKLIDTLSKARQGLGRMAFRRTLAKEMPYFHVWFEIDGGLGHIVEDAGRWPKGDLFAREIVGGMLDVPIDVVKRQGRWDRGDRRVDGFRKRWKKFDWTRVLTS